MCLDTNVLIRHFTSDPPDTAARATAAHAGADDLLLADLVVAECVDVLESFYDAPRAQVAELMRAAIALPSIRTVDPIDRARPSSAESRELLVDDNRPFGPGHTRTYSVGPDRVGRVPSCHSTLATYRLRAKR